MNHSLHLRTQRLELLRCSLEVAQAVITRNKSQVERLLGVRVPDDWYTSEVTDILSFKQYSESMATLMVLHQSWH